MKDIANGVGAACEEDAPWQFTSSAPVACQADKDPNAMALSGSREEAQRRPMLPRGRRNSDAVRSSRRQCMNMNYIWQTRIASQVDQQDPSDPGPSDLGPSEARR